MIELWLVRHGETDWNLKRLLQGWVDTPLNQTGRHQSQELAGCLRERSFVEVWSSDLLRAADTARLAYGEPTQEAALREIDFGDIQGWNWDDMPKEMRRRMIACDGFFAPGGESHAQMQDRVVRFLNGLETGAHLVFTHGGVIRMLRRLCGDDRFPGSCELTRLDWTNRRALALD